MASDEFVDIAKYTLDFIKSRLPDWEREVADSIVYDAEYRPNGWQYAATGTPPNYKLLGMYIQDPLPHIYLFEEPIVEMADTFGSIYDAVQATLVHELFQHGFGLDHTRETIEAGLTPASVLAAQPSACGCGGKGFILPYALPFSCGHEDTVPHGYAMIDDPDCEVCTTIIGAR